MSKLLEDKVAVVTGGSRGIGKAIVKRLIEEGAAVVFGSRTLSEISETVDEFASFGNVSGLVLDVRERESIREFVNQTLSQLGKIDILVNCAGTNFRVPAIEYPEDEWERVIDINLNGAYRMCQEVGRHMLERKFGKVINITSMMSHVVTPNQSAYACSKAALAQYTKLLAVEWAKYNINVNAVSPGYIETDLTKKVFAHPDFRDQIIAKTPQERFGYPEEIADAVVFLASDRASFVNGHILAVDGGFLAGHPAIVPRT